MQLTFKNMTQNTNNIKKYATTLRLAFENMTQNAKLLLENISEAVKQFIGIYDIQSSFKTLKTTRFDNLRPQ